MTYDIGALSGTALPTGRHEEIKDDHAAMNAMSAKERSK